MALARICAKNSLLNMPVSVWGVKTFETRRLPSLSCSYSLLSTSSDDKGGNQVAVAEQDQTSQGSRRSLFWRNPLNWNLRPFLSKNNGLGSLSNALVQVSDNLNKLLENISPSRLLGRVREDDKCYKLRFEVPGLSKDDLKITVEDGFLVITGERKEEDGEFDDDDRDGWFAQRYGYYNTSLLLPDDAKVDEIKAEVKNGLLYVTIPRAEPKKKNVHQVHIQ